MSLPAAETNSKKLNLSSNLLLLALLFLFPFIAMILREPNILREHSVFCFSLFLLSALFASLLVFLVKRKLRIFCRLMESLGEDNNSNYSPEGDMGKIYDTVTYLFADKTRSHRRMDRFYRELLESKENYGTSTEELPGLVKVQSEKLWDMLELMESMGELFQNISQDMGEVYRITLSLKEAFLTGFELVESSLTKMGEIDESNRDTLKGILFLSERIEKIWEIINIINQITDQTKIIAFNAELEAAAAGDAGKNFQIVASEIRRLADSTMSSTNEIKGKITEIQHSSDNLIISSENGTELINEGNRLSKDLEQVFEEVLHSTEIATTSTEEISSIFNEQVVSSNRILEKLRQASVDMDDLSKLTDRVKESYNSFSSVTELFSQEIHSKKIENKG
jgi:methyl-accepting chemotaxis protein